MPTAGKVALVIIEEVITIGVIVGVDAEATTVTTLETKTQSTSKKTRTHSIGAMSLLHNHRTTLNE